MRSKSPAAHRIRHTVGGGSPACEACRLDLSRGVKIAVNTQCNTCCVMQVRTMQVLSIHPHEMPDRVTYRKLVGQLGNVVWTFKLLGLLVEYYPRPYSNALADSFPQYQTTSNRGVPRHTSKPAITTASARALFPQDHELRTSFRTSFNHSLGQGSVPSRPRPATGPRPPPPC